MRKKEERSAKEGEKQEKGGKNAHGRTCRGPSPHVRDSFTARAVYCNVLYLLLHIVSRTGPKLHM